MKTINKEAAKVFQKLIEKLNDQDYVKISNSKSFMPLSIEKIQTDVDLAGRKVDIFAGQWLKNIKYQQSI
jgi:hypothetical protein